MGTQQEFDFSVDLLDAMLWQYNSAPNLLSILEKKKAWYDLYQSEFWENWIVNVFSLETANDFGLSVWAIILNIPIIVATSPSDPTTPGLFFGTLHKNFTHGNFFRQGAGAVHLTTEQARTVLRMRYFQITSKGTVPEINRFMNILFSEDGGAYVLDGGNMTAEYVFRFVPASQLSFIFLNYDILPRPAGVSVIEISITNIPFGFGTNNENFNNGNFLR